MNILMPSYHLLSTVLKCYKSRSFLELMTYNSLVTLNQSGCTFSLYIHFTAVVDLVRSSDPNLVVFRIKTKPVVSFGSLIAN